MSERRCKNCKHWTRIEFEDWEEHKDGLGECNKVDCVGRDGLNKDIDKDKIVANAGYEFVVFPYVGCNFGCIHFEEG